MHLREEKSLLAGMHRFLVLLMKFFVFIIAYASFAFITPLTASTAEQIAVQSENVSNPGYHALIIGNNNYRYFPKLKTPVIDASEVESILNLRYGFKTKLLTNATRKDILTALNRLRQELSENDSLLIYYAGHGEYDKTADKAYWLPVDAEKDNPVDWIMADDITSNIKRMWAKHVIIVSDSCYSGILVRSGGADLKQKGDRQLFLKKMMERPSRTLMASGGNEPVWDSGGGKHSVFAASFLKALRETEEQVFTAEELFHGGLKEFVAGKSDQVPEYSNIKNSGHEGGDFIFRRTKSIQAPIANKPQTPAVKPDKSAFSLEDLEIKSSREEQTRSAWKEKLKAMESAMQQVTAYEQKDISADLKATAWMRLAESFPDQNPYSNRDDEIRSKATERITYWKSRQSPPASERSPAKAGVSGNVAQIPNRTFEKPKLSPGDYWIYESDRKQEKRIYTLKGMKGKDFVFLLETIDESGMRRSAEKVFDENLNDEDAPYPIYRFPFAPGDQWSQDFYLKITGSGQYRLRATCEAGRMRSMSVDAGVFQDCVRVSCNNDGSSGSGNPSGRSFKLPSFSHYCRNVGIVIFNEGGKQFKLTEFKSKM